jgi:hypothetical protein
VKVITTAGLTPFDVEISGSVFGMVKFVRALARTGAKVSGTRQTLGKTLKFLVWIDPRMIALFSITCEPLGFNFIGSDAIRSDGNIDPEKFPERKPPPTV